MADAFLKLVSGGKKSKGAALTGLLHSSKQTDFNTNNSPFAISNAKSNPFQSTSNNAPIRIDSNTNNLAMLGKIDKKKKKTEDQSDEPTQSTKSSRISVPNKGLLQEIQRRHSILVDGEDIPGLLPSFELMSQEYSIPKHIASNLTSSLQDGGFGFSEPTPVQMQTIPALMSQRDVMAFAPTGSGKTLAFALPMVQLIYHYSIALRLNADKKKQQDAKDSEKKKALDLEVEELGQWVEETLGQPAGYLSPTPPSTTKYALPIHGIVLCPTRELALQTHRVYQKILRKREEFFAAKMDEIDNLAQIDTKSAQKALSDLKKVEEEILYIQPTLLTKKWKARCIKGFDYSLTGAGLVKKSTRMGSAADGEEGDEDDEGENSDEEENDKEEHLEVDTELQDCDDELNQDGGDGVDGKSEKHEEKNGRNNKFSILIATPLLLLSLLDRCHRIMKKDYLIQYQAYHAYKHYSQQRKQYQKFMNSIATKSTKPAPKSTKSTKLSPKQSKPSKPSKISSLESDYEESDCEPAADSDDDGFEVEVVGRVTEKDLQMGPESSASAFPKILSACQMFTIDECDRLLDLGFLQQVNDVLFHTQRVQDLYDIEQCTKTVVVESKSVKSKKDDKSAQKPPKTTTVTSYQLSSNRRRMVTTLVSATITPSINILSQKMLTMPIKVTIGEENVAQLSITQRLMYVSDETGKRLGMKQILSQGASLPLLVFVQSKERATQLAHELQTTFSWLQTTQAGDALQSLIGSNSPTPSTSGPQKDFSRVGVLHADLSEHERLNTVTRFRIGEIWVLICTDVISRGLDFIHVKCVLNYDFPSSTTSYLHRIGRTGRGGYKGTAVTFVTDQDRTLLPNVAHIVKHSETLQRQQLKEQYKKVLFTELVSRGEMDDHDAMYDIDSDDEGFLQYRQHLRREQLGQRTGTDVNKLVKAQIHQNIQNKQLYNQLNSKKALKKAQEKSKNSKFQKDQQPEKKYKGPGENTMSDVNNLLVSGKLTATAMVLGTGNPDDSGVADWMLALPMATAKEQQTLLYKAPIREDITHMSKNKQDKFKQSDMKIFHQKKGAAVRLGITTRNEVGRVLSDKLDKSNAGKDGDKKDKDGKKTNKPAMEGLKRKQPPARQKDDDDEGNFRSNDHSGKKLKRGKSNGHRD